LKGNGLRNLWRRVSADWSEQLTDNAIVSELQAHLCLGRACLPGQTDEKRLDALLKSCRRIENSASRRLLRAQLMPFLTGHKKEVARLRKVGWDRYYGSFGKLQTHKALTTSLVLKAPGPNGEKGVLYCSFEYNWMRLLAHYDAAAILREYYLVGATSWSPTDYASLAGFAGLSDDPLFIGVSNLADLDRVALLRPVAEPLPILASDWIHPDHFKPKPRSQRTIDIIMVANWTKTKRHWLLFEALSKMPRNLRVVLIGRNGPNRTEKEIRAEARAFGAYQDLEIHTNLEAEEVAALQCDARIATIFTKREGSCVAVPESLFAGSPVAMMEEAHIGSKAYINERTGVLLRRRGLAHQLQTFLEESDRYTPREWAVQNISCLKTSDRLNETLKSWALQTGRPWTVDIAPLCWRYVPSYVHSADKVRLAPAVADLETNYGVILEEFPGERAAKAREDARSRAAAEVAA
jgi:glycosyltransferase involved in cell wall biosynthesis